MCAWSVSASIDDSPSAEQAPPNAGPAQAAGD
jgi:hypothetical protein